MLWPPSPWPSAVRQSPRRRNRHARGREGGRSGGAGSRSVRSWCGPGRRGPRDRHVRGRRSRVQDAALGGCASGAAGPGRRRRARGCRAGDAARASSVKRPGSGSTPRPNSIAVTPRTAPENPEDGWATCVIFTDTIGAHATMAVRTRPCGNAAGGEFDDDEEAGGRAGRRSSRASGNMAGSGAVGSATESGRPRGDHLRHPDHQGHDVERQEDQQGIGAAPDRRASHRDRDPWQREPAVSTSSPVRRAVFPILLLR